MARLPNANSRAIRLNLINVPTLNSNVLRLLDGDSRSDNGDSRRPLYDHGLGDNRLLNDNGLLNNRRCRYDCRGGLHNDGLGIVRASQRRTYHATNDSADETRPEAATTAPPIAAMMVGVMNDMIPRRRRRRAMRTMPSAMMRRGNRRASRQRQPREKNRNRFDGLVHITPSLSFRSFCSDCEAMSEGPTPSPAYRELGNRLQIF